MCLGEYVEYEIEECGNPCNYYSDLCYNSGDEGFTRARRMDHDGDGCFFEIGNNVSETQA